MAEIGGSVEDYLAKKLKLNELTKKEQIEKILEYFKSIINGEIRSTPPEFSGLLQLMINKLGDDDEALFTKYILRHEDALKDFFVRNFQRFNYYDFKHKFMVLKGEIPEQEFTVPVHSKLNYEKIEPLNITPYVEILEANPLDIKLKQAKTEKTNLATVLQEKTKAKEMFDKKIETFKQALRQSIGQGLLSKEIAEQKLTEVEEMCISAIQMRYNSKTMETLKNIFLGETDNGFSPSKVFDELKMSVVSRELFYRLLVKKLK